MDDSSYTWNPEPERGNEGKYEIVRTTWLAFLIQGNKVDLTEGNFSRNVLL